MAIHIYGHINRSKEILLYYIFIPFISHHRHRRCDIYVCTVVPISVAPAHEIQRLVVLNCVYGSGHLQHVVFDSAQAMRRARRNGRSLAARCGYIGQLRRRWQQSLLGCRSFGDGLSVRMQTRALWPEGLDFKQLWGIWKLQYRADAADECSINA